MVTLSCLLLVHIFLNSNYIITGSFYEIICVAVEAVTFTKELQDIKVTSLKAKIVLECELSKPGLKVEWYKGDKKLRRDERYDVVTDGRTHQLVIEKVSADDIGEYKAVYQKISTSAKVSVEGKKEYSYCYIK